MDTDDYLSESYFLFEEGNGENRISLDGIENFIFAPIQLPDEEVISKEEMEKINNVIQQLPPRCKHVFFLAKIERLSYKKRLLIYWIYL